MECMECRNMFYTWTFIVIFDLLIHGIVATTQAEVEKHLAMGKEMLAKGQLADALSHYNAAVDGDPTNYLTYYKRGTVYLAVGKSRFALSDLNKVVELKPDFTAARLQRGNVLLKQCMLDDASKDFEVVLEREPNNEEASRGFYAIEPLQEEIRMAKSRIVNNDCGSAVLILTKVIEICPWDPSIRELRGDCYASLGNMREAISDIRVTTKQKPDNTKGYNKLSMLHYMLGEVEESLREVRECLKLDPEHKDCFGHYKKVKKLAKQMENMQEALNKKDYKECIEMANKVLSTEPTVDMIVFQAKDKLCHCYLKDDNLSESMNSCNEALEIQEDPRILCDRAEVYIANELFDDAIQDYKKALEINGDFRRAREGLERAQKLQKQSERRDYYKILGVRRNAGKREIIKAYRKLAQKWHPDNFQGDEKKKAEKKFIDIAAAKEVLTDPEKREKFDNGEDPLDPESEAGHGFNPFQHFHHFQGSPFQFKFHFN